MADTPLLTRVETAGKSWGVQGIPNKFWLFIEVFSDFFVSNKFWFFTYLFSSSRFQIQIWLFIFFSWFCSSPGFLTPLGFQKHCGHRPFYKRKAKPPPTKAATFFPPPENERQKIPRMMDLGRGGFLLHMASHFLLSMLDFWQVPSGKCFLGAASNFFLSFLPRTLARRFSIWRAYWSDGLKPPTRLTYSHMNLFPLPDECSIKNVGENPFL